LFAAIEQKSTRAQELKAKEVSICDVQASKVEKNELDEWVKKNDIFIHVGIIEDDEKKIRFAWGIKSLPWLILTDRNHIVTSEGFSVSEVGDKKQMNIRHIIQKIVLGGITLLMVMLCGKINSNPVQQPANRESGINAVPQTCVLSGKVINSDTGEPVPYFHLLHMKSNGGLIEHLETDEKGRFHTTATRGNQRYFQFDRSRRGTYIIDFDRQDTFVPFRGIIRTDIKDFSFKVKLWPVKVLTGKVLGKTGGTVNNASVYIHSDVPAVKTDSSGMFEINVAPTDRDFDLFAISEDMNQAGLVHLKKGSTTATINLQPTASYKGRVIDNKGMPVGPFKFLINLPLNGCDNYCWYQEIQTDTDGTFTVDYLYPKTSYQVRWYPDEQINNTIGEYGSKIIDLTKQKSNENIEIVVEQYLNKLSGIVCNADGAPITDAKIMVLTHSVQAQHKHGKAVYSDKEGRFRHENLADGEALIYIYAKGYKSRQVWTSTDTENLDIALRLPSQTSICEVYVVNDDYKPILNAPVNLSFIESGRLLTSQASVTNAEGIAEFRIKDFGDKVRTVGTVSCDIEGYDLAYNSVSDNCDSQVKLVLHHAGEYWSGKIVDPQQNPVAGAKLYLISMAQRVKTPERTTVQALDQSFFPDPSESTMLAQTNAKGEFVLHRFNNEDFVRIAVKAPGFKSQQIDFSPEDNRAVVLVPHNISIAKDFVFQLSPGVAVVRGLLVDESSGRPLSNVNIELRAQNNLSRDVSTDKDGTFIIEDLEPGEYVPVMKTSEGTADKNYVCVPDVLVAESGKTMQVTLKARDGIVLKGRLIESRTQQRPSAKRVYLEARLKSGQTISSDSIDENGNWELLLPPGDYNLYCSILLEDISRFVDSEEPLSVTIENKEYEALTLEISDRGSLSLQPPSLIGRAIPGFKDLNLSPLPDDTNNKTVLFCFFDMQQRPSRNCIVELGKRVEELKEKGVTTVIIQASKVDTNELDEWLKKNNILFPIGMVQGNAEKISFIWGVKSLPWLILTNREHVVTAEGFGLNEVNEKIEEIGPSVKTPADSIEVTGLVKGPNGQILSGVRVTEFQTDKEYITDEDGTFVSVFEPSSERRFFFAVDRSHQFVGVGILPPGKKQVEINLTPAKMIGGTVVDPDGRPVAGAQVAPLPMTCFHVLTDEQGNFDLGWNPEWAGDLKEFFLMARHLGRNLAGGIEFDENTKTVRIELAPALTLTGTVEEPNGVPIPGAVVGLSLRRGWACGTPVRKAITDNKGRYRFPTLLQRQEYINYAEAKGFWRNQITTGVINRITDIEQVEPIILKRPNLSVSGTVLSSNGELVAGIPVHLEGEGQPDFDTRTDAEGRFLFEKVCSGPVQISAKNDALFGKIEIQGGTKNVKLVVRPRFE